MGEGFGAVTVFIFGLRLELAKSFIESARNKK
jgi:hypothetical protein